MSRGEDKFISLADAERIGALREKYGHHTSSHAFQTLYIWRNFVGRQLHLEMELFSLRYEAKGPNTWLFPCGAEEDVCRFIAERMDEPDFALCYLRAQDKALLERRFPGAFSFAHCPGDGEDIVDRAGHIQLAGKAYEKLRNKARRAERDHVIHTQPLGDDDAREALAIVKAWRANRTTAGSLALVGDEEDKEPLCMMANLGIEGILMLVDGQPFGVAAWYPLGDGVCDLFLAKESQRDPVLGYCLRRELMRSLPEDISYVNLEDDLDIEGLRAMKKQMAPVQMNDMWMARRNDDAE